MTLNIKDLVALSKLLDEEGQTKEAAEVHAMIKSLAEPVEMGADLNIQDKGPTEMGHREPTDLLREMEDLKVDLSTDKDSPSLKESIQKVVKHLEEFLSNMLPPPTGAVPVGAVASRIVGLADSLDAFGWSKEAGQVDELLHKFAVTLDMGPGSSVQKKPKSDVGYKMRPELPKGFGKSKPRKDVSPISEKALSQDELEAKMKVQLEKLKPAGYDEHMEQENFMKKLDSLNWNEHKSPDSSILKIIEDLRKAGWQIFSPGELEQWMSHKDYIKAPELPGVRITDEDLEDDETTKTAEALNTKLPQWLPGAFDLNSPDRLGNKSEKIKQKLDLIWGDLPVEVQEDIGSKIEQYDHKQKTLTDQDVMSEIEKAEKEKGVRWASKATLLSKLAEVADKLDAVGAVKEAELIDGFIKKHADDEVLDYEGEDDSTDQSKRYDSEYHHSLQIREPKTKQERVDREGRDTHHIHTYQSQEGMTGQKKEAHSLSTRYCPKHVGVTMGRVGESTYQCPLDGEVFNWETGWTDHDGGEHPGGSVAAQTPDSSGYSAIPHRIFDSRENISNRVN